MFEINYSKINSYLFCPYLYKFSYIDRKYTQHNPKTSFGLSIHKTLKDFAQKKLDLKRLLFAYEENWCNYGYTSPQQMLEYYDMGIEMLKKFYNAELTNNSKILYSEDIFKVEINDDVVLRGTVDRVDKTADGKIEIVDYKMGFEEKENGYEKNSLQLKIYAYGISKKYSINIDYISYYFLMNQKKIRIEYKPDDDLIPFLIDCYKKIQFPVFDRKGRCDICLAKNLCEFSDFKKDSEIPPSL